MSDPYLGEIRAVAFNFAPYGWALCNGQLLAISSNQALFTLLGTVYGGDGRSSFGLPNLQGRSIAGVGVGQGFEPIQQGEMTGAQNVAISINNMPLHTHPAIVTDPGHNHDTNIPTHSHTFTLPSHTHGLKIPTATGGTAALTSGGINITGYSPQTEADHLTTDGGTSPLATGSTDPWTGSSVASSTAKTGITVTNGSVGFSTPLPIQSPVLGMYYIIATMGIFPSRG